MPDNLDPYQHQQSTPAMIYVACALGFLNAINSLLFMFTELAYMVGRWYMNFLLISSILILVSLVGIWKMKRWGVLGYTALAITTQIVSFKYNMTWTYASLILPVIVLLAIWHFFKRMS